jgi:tetratricopeptide (TPR) repeat protein
MSWRYNIRLEAAKSEYWLARGDLRRAEEYARQLFEVATQHNCRKYIAVAHKLLAEIFIARSDLAEAEKELQAALDLLRKYPVPVEAWKTYAALGRLHLRSGNSHLARESFAQADELIRQIAARVDDEKLRAVFLNSAAVREIRDGMVSDFEPGS